MSHRQGFNPTTFTSSVGPSGVAWNPATLTAQATLTSGQSTQWLRATGFNFTSEIGDNDTIQGIEVTVTRQDANGTGAVNAVVQLVHNGSAVGIQKSGGGTWPGSAAAITYGASADTWSTSLTPAQIRDASFGVQLYAFMSGPGTSNPQVSQITLRVHYLQKLDATPPESAPPCPGDCDCPCKGKKAATDNPVEYGSGQIELAVADLGAGGFGHAWGHERVYSNRLSRYSDIRQGFNWLVRGWPYLMQKDSTTFVFVRTTDEAVWFDYNSGTGVYTPRHGAKFALTHDSTNNVFNLASEDGDKFTFHNFTQSTYPKGLFKSLTTPGGQTITVQSYNSDGRITEVQRSYSSGGSTTTESLKYDFLSSGDNQDRLEYVTLRRKVDAGAWSDLRRAKYEYYAAIEDHGSQGDLKRVTIQLYSGSWQDLDVYYYRYYKAGETNGGGHLLKYVVNPESYRRLDDGADPLTASNAVVAPYADHYFEFDSSGRVTKEVVDGGSRTTTLAYTTSSHGNGYNNWKTKTVETKPDGSQNVVYTNYLGQALVLEHKSGSDNWIETRAYDSAGRLIERATPAAVVSYDDTAADLDITLRTSDGLIHVTDHYTTTGSGAAAGYVQHEKIKKGSSGTPIKLRSYEYTSQTAGGVTVYPVSKETVYRNDDGTGAIDTTYSYTFHSGTVRVLKRTTTLPAVSTSHNGSGSANTREEVYNVHGNLEWTKDEHGAITRHKYDIVKGALTQTIQDVDTAQVSDEPSGWSTVSSFGLHLTSDYEVDDLGRTTQVLGPVHNVDIAGTDTAVRTAGWTVYKDIDHEVWAGQGYGSGSGFSTYTLVNPLSITKLDHAGRATDQIVATRASTSGKLTASDSFAQATWVRWSKSIYNDEGDLTASRVYHTIPSSGEGTSGTNYDAASFGYDASGRQNKQATPGGTITRTVFDIRGRVKKVYIGTNDNGATDADPTGGGATGNNMVLVTEHEYDGNADEANGNLTKTTQHVDGSTTRVTTFSYDWRDRQTFVDGEVDFYQENTYDNLGRVTKVDRKNTTSGGNLVARSETFFDDLGRAYQTKRYAVNVSNGTVGNALVNNTWYDAAGHVIKQKAAGSEAFAKSVYNGLGRKTKTFIGFDTAETSYADAGTVTGDTIFEQTETAYDTASNVTQVTLRRRLHTATGTGELTSPSGSQPKARVSYVAMYPDAVGRGQARTNYGTNGGSSFSRAATIPARSDTILVDSSEYNSRGEAFKSIDPKGQDNRSEWNHAGQLTKSIANYFDGDPATGTADQDVTVELTYNADGQIATRKAKNSTTGDQTTTYVYGVTTSVGSDLAHNGLLRTVIYPDSDDVASPLGNGADSTYDRVELKYNRLGELKERKDQNETVHVFELDKLGRQTHDRVTSVGSGIDNAVLRLSRTYEVRGLVEKATSYDNATVGSGAIVNEVQFSYNDFGQLENDYQSHSGAVNTGTTPKVAYTYANGSANHVRRTKITYPNGRFLHIGYNSGADESLGRVSFLADDSSGSPGTHLAEYTYLGLGMVAKVDYTEPDLRCDLAHGTGDDPFDGLDRFDRVVDLLWRDYGSSIDVERVKHGYDRAGNRLWRECPVPAAQNPAVHMDELYTYDGIYQLKTFKRGDLNGTKDAIASGTLKFAQEWSFDPTGNWTVFKEDATGDSTFELDQSRTHNKFNEITQIAGSSSHVAHDRAGNMTKTPKSDNWTASHDNVYDAWNRLVTVKDGANKVIDNSYDALTRRTLKKVYVSGTLDHTRHYYYSDSWQVLEERKDTATRADRQFLWGPRSIDDLVLRDRDADGSASTGNLGVSGSGVEERIYCLQDPSWNVTVVADVNGDTHERCTFAAYGKPFFLTPTYGSRSSSSYDWDSLFSGYCRDGEHAIYAVRHRWLAPTIGRWLTHDPATTGPKEPSDPRWFSDSLGSNVYPYAANSPVNLTDPSGLHPQRSCQCVSGQNSRDSIFDGSDQCAFFVAVALVTCPKGCELVTMSMGACRPSSPGKKWRDTETDCFPKCTEKGQCNNKSKTFCQECADFCYTHHTTLCAGLKGPAKAVCEGRGKKLHTDLLSECTSI